MPRTPIFDTLLLLALPASGKSEVRRFMRHAPPERRVGDYHLGDTVQLDDFPYVHFFRRVDDGLLEAGAARAFYRGEDAPFVDRRDWGTLLRLVSEDYALLRAPADPTATPASSPEWLFARIDRARASVGAAPVFSTLAPGLRARLARGLAGETERLVTELFGRRPDALEGKTVVIEFARGGPEGSTPPFAAPHGYAWSLAQLSSELLERAAVLYIWVTPEESRRKNLARADPDDPGSILHHSCPMTVMLEDYGACDFGWLLEHSDLPDTVRIEAHGRVFHLPAARFDNRIDKTSFLRDDPETWDPDRVEALHAEISEALRRLWGRYGSSGAAGFTA